MIDGLPPGGIICRRRPQARGTVEIMVDFLTGYVLGERSASRAAALSRSAGGAAGAQITGELADLDQRIDRLLLVVDALWSILRERGYTDEDLAHRISQIDSQDGTIDGARTPRPRPCPNCQSMVEPGRARCAFCGADVAGSGPLDRI